jgi:hypothetical protein
VLTDDLSAVLDDAAYNNDAKASAGTLSYAEPKLAWSGPLPVAGTVTITYSVTVHNPDHGDGTLHNVVITPGDPGGITVSNCPIGSSDPSCIADATVKAVTIVSPPTATPPAPAADPPPPSSPKSPLAFTGLNTQLQLIVVGLLVAFGGVLSLAGVRRRRTRQK